MTRVKLQKIGNSFGFRIPKQTLDGVGFRARDQYELIEESGGIVIVKRGPAVAKWKFASAKLDADDRAWLDADLGES
jgi:antitoxin component of MazEF toxin-antitoxin module